MANTSSVEIGPAICGGEREFTEIGVSVPSQAYLSIAADFRRARPRSRKRTPQAVRLPKLNLTVTQSAEGDWFADEPVTGQFGVGATPPEAVADLISSLHGYLSVMQARRYRLAPHLLRQLEWLEGRLPG